MPPRHRLNFQHMLYLEALVEEKHVTRAAERMSIGQPAMSSALAKLRLVFKDPLLIKTSAGMEPTPRALELIKRIRDVTDLLDGRGLALAEFEPDQSNVRFRIMASDGISRVVLPRLMARAQSEAPNIQFTVSPGDPRRIGEYLRDGDIDISLVFVRKPPAELRQMVLYPQRLVCIARQGHASVDQKISLKQFVAQNHARWGAPPVPHATMEAMVDEVLEDLGHARRVSLRVSSITLLPGVVAATNLLAVIPEQLALSAQETLPIQILPLPFKVPSVDVSMVWHERSHNDPAHKWLRGLLKAVGAELATTAGAGRPAL